MEVFEVTIKGNTNQLKSSLKDAEKQLTNFKDKTRSERKLELTVSIAKLERDLVNARKQIKKFRDEGNRSAEITARVNVIGLQDNLTKARRRLREFNAEADKTKKGLFSLNGIVRDAAKAFLGFEAIRQAGRLLKGIAGAAIGFESAFAGVKKTLKASDEDFAVINKQLRELARLIPISANELAKIGELGGQLGVGIDDITKFTETVAKIAVTTNLTAEEAAVGFARIANILQEPIANVENFASGVVELGNNFATTEREIVEFATRISGAAKVAGFVAEDVFAIGTAFSSVGIKAEAGGTAVSKVITEFSKAVTLGGDQLDNFAATAGKTSEEFAELFRKDAGKAFEEFVLGLGRQGDEAFFTLEKLGLEDRRLAQSFLSLSNAGDLLTRAIDTNREAVAKNVALNDEANERFDTTESKLRVQKQRWVDLGITLGDFLKKVLVPTGDFFVSLGESVVNGGAKLAGFAKAIKLTGVVLVSSLGVRVFSGITNSLKKFTVATTASKEVLTGFTGLKSNLKNLFLGLTNPIGQATVAVSLIALAFLKAKKDAAELKQATDKLKESLNGLGDITFTSGQLGNEIDGLLDKVAESQQKLTELRQGGASSGAIGTEKINQSFQDFKGNLDELKSSVVDVALGFGFSQGELRKYVDELEFFNSEIQPTKADQELLTKLISDGGDQFQDTARKFRKNVDAMVSAGATLEEAFGNTFESIGNDFQETEGQAEAVSRNILDEFIANTAELGDVGEAYSIAFAGGLSSEEAKQVIEDSGIEVTDELLGLLLKKAIEAEDAGRVYTLLLASGMDAEKAKVISSSKRLGEAVIQGFADRQSAIDEAGKILGQTAVSGIVAGIKKSFPELVTAANAIATVFGVLAPDKQKALNDSIANAQGLIAQAGTISKIISASDTITDDGDDKRPPGGGSGGGRVKKEDILSEEAKEALKQAKEEAKKVKKEVQDYTKSVQANNKAAEKLRDDSVSFFKDIQNSIAEAEEEIVNLKDGFEDFEAGETTSFVQDVGQKNVELLEEEEKLRKNLANLERQKSNGELSSFDDLNDARSELNKNLKEQEEIEKFINQLNEEQKALGEDGIKVQEEFNNAVATGQLSEFAQDKINFDQRIKQREEEVKAEIEKQRRIIDIQSQFLSIQESQDAKIIEARNKLIKDATGDELLSVDERGKLLQDLGLNDLTNQEQLDIQSQLLKGETIQNEIDAIAVQQQKIFDERFKFLIRIEDEQKKSVRRQIDETDKLIERIEDAQKATLALNRLREEGPQSGGTDLSSGGETNISVVNNNASSVDFEAATNSLIDKIQ